MRTLGDRARPHKSSRTSHDTILASSRIDLGFYPSFACEDKLPWPFVGGISLRETLQLIRSTVMLAGTDQLVSFTLASPSNIGILVERVVGHHRLFGHVVPRLVTVGRVPFGRFARGSHKVHWDLRVNGHKLRRGTYLVTPRLLNRDGVVHELGTPRTVRIH